MIDEQIELETTQVQRGVERYEAHAVSATERGRDMDAGPLAHVITDIMDRMVPLVKDHQRTVHAKLKRAITRGERLGGWEIAFDTMDAAAISYIATRTVLTLIDREWNADRKTNDQGSERHAIATRIGTVMSYQYAWDTALADEKERAKANPPNRLNKLRKTIKEINPRFVRRWLKKVDDVGNGRLDQKTCIALGLNVLDLFTKASEGIIDFTSFKVRHYSGTRTQLKVDFAPEVRAALKAAHIRRAVALPWLLPMIAPPVDWAWDGTKYVGGYYKTDVPFLKGHFATLHTADILTGDVVPAGVLAAVNRVNKTPWCINNSVLEVAREAIKGGVDEILPVAAERELPLSIPPAEWAKMTKEEQSAASAARRAIHDHNNTLRARRDAMGRQLDVATEFCEYPAIYFPHNLDFRGRVYPMPQDLHPQSNDFGRSLLKFATAKTLGESGFLWLCYHVANTFGLDKEDRTTQRAWVLDNLEALCGVARSPLRGGLEMIKHAEEPWQFLAACQELEAAFASGNPYTFKSALPVYVDGTCNGLQHLSAMGLDPVGAAAVNLTDGPRQDIYQIVSDKVTAMVPADNPWHGRVTRKTVKRGVMTVPYGLTDVGMRDQLIQEGLCSSLDGEVLQNATFMRDCMKEAISETVVAATEIMGWMQDNATILAKNGKAVEWTTPSGFRVRQAYYKTVAKKITTIAGRAILYEKDADAQIRVKKQATSIAPNIIHSFDAAHMILTIAAAGDISFSVIHDSFGTHAADMPALGLVIREQFVEMYKTNWFESLQAEFQAMVGPDVPLIKPPARGDFKIEQVLNSNFFFA